MHPLHAAAHRLRPWTLDALTSYCRIPSVSAQTLGIREAAEFVARRLRELGLDVRIVRAGGNPAVLADSGPVRGGRSLVFYNHYDVQPPDPLNQWTSPPFTPTLRGGRLFARGVADNKANLIARIAAVRAFRDAGVPLPVQVKFFVEGEEEISSPSLSRLVRDHARWLKSDLCIWESGYRDERGRPRIDLGCKGLVHGELVCRGARTDLHSARSVIVPSPVWRLLWALASIKGDDERVRVAGFYGRVRKPTAADRAAAARLRFDEPAMLRELGLPRFLLGLRGAALAERFYFSPAFNISGLTAGYQGPGNKTVLPREARAKFDVRLVPDMTPDDTIRKLRLHLDRNGFRDVAIEDVHGYPAARTPAGHPYVRLVADAGREAFGREVGIQPTMAASGPMHLFRRLMPCIGFGTGFAGSNIHAPNESIYVQDLHRGVSHVIGVIERLGRA